ncbi:MAG TPA: hypothetical protein GX697_05430 [Firmicutes bacterium]|nr:hypothetical protein [Bacillota bacterium]
MCLLVTASLVFCRISLCATKGKDLSAREDISFLENEDINLLLLSDKYSNADLLAKDLQDEFGTIHGTLTGMP